MTLSRSYYFYFMTNLMSYTNVKTLIKNSLKSTKSFSYELSFNCSKCLFLC